jgi:predicted Rossmann-fold nucleotide-binding protein
MHAIIAIFGGTVGGKTGDKKAPQAEVGSAARHLGYQVGRQGCLVLTGGTGPDAGPVKGEALRGADRAADEGNIAPWIAVPQKRDEPWTGPQDHKRSIVLPAVYDSRRNYLEAFICDVAIALPGSDGTVSEVAFCLGLGRPVVLVGDLWDDVWPVMPGDQARAAFVKQAYRRVKHSKGRAPAGSMESLIDQAYDDLPVDVVGPTTARLPASDEAAAPVVELARSLARHPSKRTLPCLPELETVSERFSAWYDDVQTRLAGMPDPGMTPDPSGTRSSGRRGD